MPINRPIIPAQPTEARYGIEKLYTCPRLTRAIYGEMFGEQAPAYNSKERIKRWQDKSVLEGLLDPANFPVKVLVYVAPDNLRWLTMTALEAATPNLPGVTVWPKYVNPVATPTVIVGPDGDRLQISGETLVDLLLARFVVNEINATLSPTFSLVPASAPWPWNIVWGLELRRRMNFSNGKNEFDAALILKGRFANGLGSPGAWALGPDGGPRWTSETPIDGEQDLRPEIPMPCRPLLENERFETVTFGGMGGVIVRTDLTVNEPAPGTGQLTAAQDAMVRQTALDTAAIRKHLGA